MALRVFGRTLAIMLASAALGGLLLLADRFGYGLHLVVVMFGSVVALGQYLAVKSGGAS